MIYTLHSKFEAAIYSTKEREFSGGSYQIELNFNRVLSKSEQKIFDKLVDLFDHSTISNYSSSLGSFIKESSARYVQTSLDVDESIYSKLVFLTVSNYIIENSSSGLELISVKSYNGKNQSVTITKEDVNSFSVNDYKISEDTFNS